jgi:hypothetical protein
MIEAGSLELALARMQARLGRRPPEAAWRAIEQSRDIAPILELCRPGSLQDVVAQLPANCDRHVVDLAIRDGWRFAVAEAKAWMPPEFASALAWLRVVPLLPFLAFLARGGDAAPWMHGEADLAAACAAQGRERAAAIAQGFLAPLAPSWNAPAELARAWHAEWRRRLPRAALTDTALARLERDVSQHLARFGVAAVHEAAPLRRALEARFVACFRRYPLEPAAGFAWLGLTALDLERLRGELARRLAFPRARLVT